MKTWNFVHIYIVTEELIIWTFQPNADFYREGHRIWILANDPARTEHIGSKNTLDTIASLKQMNYLCRIKWKYW
jgi:hypothetical protein